MQNRYPKMAAVVLLTTGLLSTIVLAVTAAPYAMADPPAPDPAVAAGVPDGPGDGGAAGDGGPPPDTGVVASADPATVTTADGWVLTVAAHDESQLPVAPLTTATSSREYLVGGTFTGTVTGGGTTKLTGGTLEVGYEIGCGIELGQVKLIGQVGASFSASPANVIPTGVDQWTRKRSKPHPPASPSKTFTSRSTAAWASPSCAPTPP